MYKYALDLTRSAAEDLGEVAIVSRRDYEERPTFKFRAQVPCLEYLSLLIENAVLLRTNRAGRVYAAFEKLSRMETAVDRFLRIADLSERLYVFGEPDWRPPSHPNMRSIHVPPGAKLAREWVVIVNSPTISVALVAQDQDGFDAPVLDERHFLAFKTSDPALVARLAAAAEEIVDSSLAA